MWTASGDLREDSESDKYLLSAFHSLLSLPEIGSSNPQSTMQAWIEDTIDAVIEADVCKTRKECEFLKFDVSGPFDSLTLEDSFFRLWKHANEGPANDLTVRNMLNVRLALSKLVGEKRQQELIGIWNTQIK